MMCEGYFKIDFPVCYKNGVKRGEKICFRRALFEATDSNITRLGALRQIDGTMISEIANFVFSDMRTQICDL